MISFIVPAHNEERLLGATLQAIRRAMVPLDEPCEILVVDADTTVDAAVVRAAVDSLRAGAVGGAAIGIFDGNLPLYARALSALWIHIARLAKLTTGCFLFCTRSAYEAAGGFDRTLFVFEDVAFGRALGRLGKVALLRETVSTSGRNLRDHSLGDAARMLIALVRNRRRFFKSREGLSYWYAGRQSRPTSRESRPNDEL